MLKMIVTDLDGTLLTSYKKVTNNTKNYLTKLKNSGYTVVIATGRVYAAAMKATDNASFANYIITDTGACAYDCQNNRTLFKNTIPKEIALNLLKAWDDKHSYINICTPSAIYHYADEAENNNVVKTTKDIDYIMDHCDNITHIVVALKSNELVYELFQQLQKEISSCQMIIMQDSFADNQWIEITPKGCTKEKGIKLLAQSLNIPLDDVMCFGDGLNDLDMLANCGQGIALANALPEVKMQAHDITEYDHNNDGVINYLRNYLE